jgi:peptide chain release factor 2
MNDLKARVKELFERLEKLRAVVNVFEKKKSIGILEAQSGDPGLWDDADRARKVMQELSDLKKELAEFEELAGIISTLDELAEDGSLTGDYEPEIFKVEKSLKKFELKSFLSGQYDTKNAIVSIHAGQGGVEAMDWTGMLFRMYLRFCEKKSWRTETLDITEGEEAGIKSITFLVEGNYAYGFLKGEAGTHRLVRQSPFNADKLRQTSFALVEILPKFEDVDLPDIEIKDEDLDWQFFRSSSKGGQNVQKVSTAVRLTHKPTGFVVTSQTERFQDQNRKIALDLLRGKLWLLQKSNAADTKKGIKGDYKPASWGTQIRSYVLHPYKMVKDLRTGVETGNSEAVLDGDLDEFIGAEVVNSEVGLKTLDK